MDKILKKKKGKKDIVAKMIEIYCRKNHGRGFTCKACLDLRDYCFKKIEVCPNIESKKFCSSCTSLCYSQEYREKIREVMAYSGPRIFLYYPMESLGHLVLSMNKKVKSGISLILGFLFMGLGAIGVFLPILPTTPFLLLASYFFVKSSDRFNSWYKNTKLYKNHLETFEREKSMTLKTKIFILGFASIMLLVPLIKIDVLPMRILIGLLYLIKYYYFIFKIKTVEDESR